ncbi:MAG: hypothetical protein R2813_00715 [Flavobacteriales bacterium]
MKNLLPIVVALIMLMVFAAVVPAQTRIHNPNLPKSLVFQWKIQCNAVHSDWRNSDFTISRGADGLIVYYGTYRTIGEAMENVPSLPEGVSTTQVSLVPFFNQYSISAADAFALAGNRNYFEMNGEKVEKAVSFTVYFGTYDQPMSIKSSPVSTEYLSFEVLPNRTFAYAAGQFNELNEAEAYVDELRSRGFDRAEVMKYLNGQKLAMVELEQIFAYADITF